MNGNVAEIVGDGYSNGEKVYRLMGGAYNTEAFNISDKHDFDGAKESTGFRIMTYELKEGQTK